MPELYRVIISPRASADIDEIFKFVDSQSPQNARGVVQNFLNAIDSLDTLPHRHRIHAQARLPDRVVYAMPVFGFIVYYRIAERSKAVRISTIVRGTRRQPKRIP